MTFSQISSSLGLSLLLSTVAISKEEHPLPKEKVIFSPIYLHAGQLQLATRQPTLVSYGHGSVHLPTWSLSGGTVGQSVGGVITGLPKGCEGVKVEIIVTNEDVTTASNFEDVYRVHLSALQLEKTLKDHYYLGKPVRSTLAEKPHQLRGIVLESFHEVNPELPLYLRIQREPGDPSDTFTKPSLLLMVKVTPLVSQGQKSVVESSSAYNSWPMMQALGNRLVCTYSRGKSHTIGEDARAVYSRVSDDGGKTWQEETEVANTAGFGEVTVGKGLDTEGNMLLWVRRVGKTRGHDLYRSKDGMGFTKISSPSLPVEPMQITDIFEVPEVGWMALWFAGDYGNLSTNSWGTLTSKDQGKTWTQHVVEDQLPKEEWPTEPAAVYLGDGKIFGIARTELGGTTSVRAQFQLQSTDSGKTWTRTRTNITDVAHSTPSLVFDQETRLISNYYYERGHGVMKRRVVRPEQVWDKPTQWPVSHAVVTGSAVMFDAGNVNATFIGKNHYLAYYSGAGSQTSVMVAKIASPEEPEDVKR